MKKFLVLSLILASLFILFSCSRSEKDTHPQHLSNTEISIIDSMFVQLNKYYALNPDTAIMLASQYEKQLLEWKEWYYLMDLYIFFGELYQYRKKDISEAMSYFFKALETKNKIENFKVEYLKSYFFYSNIGNILFNYEYYDDALDVYKESLQIVQKDTSKEALVVILNNIGLTYFKMNECDSAYKYFLSAKQNINTRIAIFSAQHYYYLSILAFKCQHEDYVPLLFSKGMAHLADYANTGLQPNDLYFFKENFEYYNLSAKLHLSLARYYALKNENDLSIINFEEALFYAKKELNNILQAEIYMSLAKTYFKIEDFNKAIDMGGFALNIWVNAREFKEAAKTSEFLSDSYSSMGSMSKSLAFSGLHKNYLDSSLVADNNFELLRRKTELSKIGILLALEDIKFQQEKMKKTAIKQKGINVFLLLIIVFIVFSVMSVIIYRNRIRFTRKFLAKRTFEIIEAEKKGKEQERMKSKHDELMIRFEELMLTEKKYLIEGLNLNELAAILKTNQAYLSQMINTKYAMSFIQYINSLRIKEACQIIQSNTDKNFTIDHLYSRLGYKSKSTFYTAFKNFTGVTPAEYIKVHKNRGTK